VPELGSVSDSGNETFADWFGVGNPFWYVSTLGIEEKSIYGYEGNDTLVGSDGPDWIIALGGDDVVFGRGGDDFIRGVRGDDTIHGGDGDDSVAGDEGTDQIFGDGGSDILTAGNNFYIVDCSICTPVERHARAGPFTAGIYGVDNSTGDDLLDGGDGDDFLYGSAGDNVLTGGTGNDVLAAGDGNDRLSGGAGRNMLIGGAGRDRLESAGDDILIAGATKHDPSDGALLKIFAEWTSPHSRAVRQANITDGSGSPAPLSVYWQHNPRTSIPASVHTTTAEQARQNDFYFLNSESLRPDNDADTVTGANGDDWQVDGPETETTPRRRRLPAETPGTRRMRRIPRLR
jgi:Ca2+-binding RTX toxin-like protein